MPWKFTGSSLISPMGHRFAAMSGSKKFPHLPYQNKSGEKIIYNIGKPEIRNSVTRLKNIVAQNPVSRYNTRSAGVVELVDTRDLKSDSDDSASN